MARFLGNGLWKELIRLGVCGGKVVVAPYYSNASGISCDAGDSVIVNATEDTIRAGQTSAALLLAAATGGAIVYSHSRLHAKILLTDDRAIVSSANVSAASTKLREAGVRLDSPEAVRAVREYVDQLVLEATPLSIADLKRLAAIPVMYASPPSRTKPSLLQAIASELPVLEDIAFGFYEGEAELEDRAVRAFARKRGLRLPPDWTWFESDDSEGEVLDEITRICRGRPLVNFPAFSRHGHLVKFKPHDTGARAFFDAFSVRGRTISAFGPPGFATALNLKLQRRELAETLTRGLAVASSRLRTRVNNRAGVLAPKDLCELYKLGSRDVLR